jgi:hypothetical protein
MGAPADGLQLIFFGVATWRQILCFLVAAAVKAYVRTYGPIYRASS